MEEDLGLQDHFRDFAGRNLINRQLIMDMGVPTISEENGSFESLQRNLHS